MANESNEQPDSQSVESPQPVDQNADRDKPYMWLWYLLVGGAFFVGCLGFFSFMSTEGCDLDGGVFRCDDGSTFSLVWPVIAGLGGLFIIGFAISERFRQSRAQSKERRTSGQQWPPVPPAAP